MRQCDLRVLSLVILFAAGPMALASGCDCSGTLSESEGGVDGGGLDASRRDGAAPGADGGDAGRAPDGSIADAGCGGGSCQPIGCTCGTGTECCSGNCDGRRCVPAGCMPEGSTCAVGTDCCSLTCGSGGTCQPPPSSCSPVGSTCTTGDDCCTGNCANPAGTACAGTGDCVCGASSECHAGGESCTSDAQCCNGLCDRPGGASTGTCALLGSCRVAGEPCGTAGYNGSCCSTVCLDSTGSGVARCQFLGGCRVQDELCTSDGECCSGACEQQGTTVDGRPIMRCANAESCLPAGEVCGTGTSNNCCPNGGGSTGCEPTGAGFRRCYGGAPGCTLPGQECTSTDECCMETFPNIMCQPDHRSGRDGSTNVCCLSQGESCAFGDVCCCGVCAPDMDGDLVCCPPTMSMCTADGDACTMDSDCCSGDCGVDAGTGMMVCSPTTCVTNGGSCTVDGDCCAGACCRSNTCTTDCGSACTAGQLGDFCTTDADCCNSPPVVCAGVEFTTCQLAP